MSKRRYCYCGLRYVHQYGLTDFAGHYHSWDYCGCSEALILATEENAAEVDRLRELAEINFKLYQEAMAMYRQAAQERDIAVAELEIRNQNGT